MTTPRPAGRKVALVAISFRLIGPRATSSFTVARAMARERTAHLLGASPSSHLPPGRSEAPVMASAVGEMLPLRGSPKETAHTWAGEPVEPGAPPATASPFAAVMNLSACALGASMLSLPHALAASGPVLALFVLAFFGLMAVLSSRAVVRAGLRCARSSYADIVRTFFGRAQGAAAEILLALALALAAMSYIVGLAGLLPTILPFTGTVTRNARIAVVLIALFPVTLVSSLASFGPASAAAVFGCYVQAAALLAELMTSDWTLPSASVLFAVHPAGLLRSLPQVCFVFAFHYVLTDTLAEVVRPTEKRLGLVALSAVGVLLACYVPVAVAGYLTLSGKNIAENLLLSLPNGSPVVSIARWSIALLLFCTYSLFLIPLRRTLEEVCFGRQTGAMLDPRRLAVAGGLMVSVGAVSVSLPSLGLANSVAGGCIAIVMFYFPGALMYRMEMDLPRGERSPVQIGAGVFFMLTGVVVCVMGLFGDLIFD